MLNFTLLDKSIIYFDSLFRKQKTYVNNPANSVQNTQELTPVQKKQSISMMRINHSGEICAQALYQGQALMAKNISQYNSLLQSAAEESAHLTWCSQRLSELNGRTSFLNPIWYAGSFGIGVLAGAAGDKISLGFLAETEYQVTAHLEKHLSIMPTVDKKSRAILQQMRTDELKHATQATQSGAANLPTPIKILMRYTAKILTFTAARI